MSELPSGGVKGVKMARFDLLPWDTLWVISLVYGFGAGKYEERNWEQGFDWSMAYGAMCRHMALFWQGEDLDEESGLPHLAHAAWEAICLLTFQLRQQGNDNRPQFDPEGTGLASMIANLSNPDIFDALGKTSTT